MSQLQAQARALGDPTRHGIFSYVARAEQPTSVAELTAHFGLNHNAIRQHLAKLVQARLLIERVGPSVGRGRPPLVYEIDPTADSRWEVTGPYERLAQWLAEVVRTGETPHEIGRRAGVRHRVIASGSDDPFGELMAQMARQGFEPTPDEDTSDIVLTNCPFESTAFADPETVCSLHLGFAEGIAEQVGGLSIGGLSPKDPRTAGCRLRVERSATASMERS